jgi:hypothetical protein
MVGYAGRNHSNTPIVVFRNAAGKHIVTAGNFTGEKCVVNVKIGKRYLNMELPAHSFSTYIL